MSKEHIPEGPCPRSTGAAGRRERSRRTPVSLLSSAGQFPLATPNLCHLQALTQFPLHQQSRPSFPGLSALGTPRALRQAVPTLLSGSHTFFIHRAYLPCPPARLPGMPPYQMPRPHSWERASFPPSKQEVSLFPVQGPDPEQILKVPGRTPWG